MTQRYEPRVETAVREKEIVGIVRAPCSPGRNGKQRCAVGKEHSQYGGRAVHGGILATQPQPVTGRLKSATEFRCA